MAQHNSDSMDYFNSDRLNRLCGFFILKLLIDEGGLTELEIQRRTKPRLGLLNSLALRMGKPSIALSEVLRSLQSQDLVKAEEASDDPVYSLTATGQQLVHSESARHNHLLSEFLESGEMDRSFQKFLDPHQPFNRS